MQTLVVDPDTLSRLKMLSALSRDEPVGQRHEALPKKYSFTRANDPRVVRRRGARSARHPSAATSDSTCPTPLDRHVSAVVAVSANADGVMEDEHLEQLALCLLNLVEQHRYQVLIDLSQVKDMSPQCVSLMKAFRQSLMAQHRQVRLGKCRPA